MIKRTFFLNLLCILPVSMFASIEHVTSTVNKLSELQQNYEQRDRIELEEQHKQIITALHQASIDAQRLQKLSIISAVVACFFSLEMSGCCCLLTGAGCIWQGCNERELEGIDILTLRWGHHNFEDQKFRLTLREELHRRREILERQIKKMQ